MDHVFLVAGGPSNDLSFVLSQRYPDLTPANCFFLGVDRGALKLHQGGFPLDLAIGDFDSLSPEEAQVIAQAAKHRIQLPKAKDLTDLEAGLTWILDQGWEDKTLHILDGFGGRVDHFLSVIWTLMRPEFSRIVEGMILEDRDNWVRLYGPGHHQVDALGDFTYLSFITLEPVTHLTLSGVAYPLTQYTCPHPMAFVSNEFLGPSMELSLETGRLLAVQSRDRK